MLLSSLALSLSSIDRVRYHISVAHLSPSLGLSTAQTIMLVFFFTNPSALCLPQYFLNSIS